MTRAGNLATDPRLLVGLWRLDRRLLDHRLGQNGCYHGELTVTEASDGLEWFESGDLHWESHVVPASRRLLLHPGADGWQMSFSDGRFFHPWLLNEQVVHPCGPDLYRGRIDAERDRMRITWRVTGAGKDQEIHTRLRRT